MELVNPKVEYLPQAEGLEGVFKQIEIAGRTCYKSEDKITEDSARKFVDRMIASKHNAMLEHGTVYLKIPFKHRILVENYIHNQFSKVVYTNDDAYITTNYRVIIENNLDSDLDYLCNLTEYHEQRFTFRITTSIGITRELIRHRHFSFANESTRYCNYSKDKFDNNITFVKPYWYDNFAKPCNKDGYREDGTSNMFTIRDFEAYLQSAENNYLAAINAGAKPQEARELLPLCTKSDIVITGFKSDWKDFLDKRLKGTTGAPHPDMKLIAAEIEKQLNLKNKNLL
jgi:thymidylate synthase (FAD)